eukprot:CAMPEP_0114555880 /NCGR_PEP_ID=MMETSP0114-20121206/8985_1 /TAXON_ID=31324 /ORGANISM="Goniomonas sp, Strain m" /LENGTH=221 /DNA_ID=CAMNT_0001741035 /DNA_START=261 /DNA_END=927 /DNA_ORIENTATION=-
MEIAVQHFPRSWTIFAMCMSSSGLQATRTRVEPSARFVDGFVDLRTVVEDDLEEPQPEPEPDPESGLLSLKDNLLVEYDSSLPMESNSLDRRIQTRRSGSDVRTMTHLSSSRPRGNQQNLTGMCSILRQNLAARISVHPGACCLRSWSWAQIQGTAFEPAKLWGEKATPRGKGAFLVAPMGVHGPGERVQRTGLRKSSRTSPNWRFAALGQKAREKGGGQG